MANQLRVDRYRCSVMMSLETVAKLRMYIKGKTVAAESIGGREVVKSRRPMTISDFIEMQMKKVADGVKLDAESRRWLSEHYESNLKRRSKADAQVKAGKFRKPKSEWLKPGRVAGKKYPKYEAAMKRLAKERMTAKRKVKTGKGKK